jgi:hypothetical protein
LPRIPAKCAAKFELVLFTASQKYMPDVLADLIDPQTYGSSTGF